MRRTLLTENRENFPSRLLGGINIARSCEPLWKDWKGRNRARESGAGNRLELAFRGRDARADSERRHASRYETIAQIRGTFSWKLNGGYRLPRASCGNGQYTPPTSNSLGRSRERERALETRSCRTGYGRAVVRVVPHARPVYTIALPLARHALVTAHHRDLCAYNKRCILNPF